MITNFLEVDKSKAKSSATSSGLCLPKTDVLDGATNTTLVDGIKSHKVEPFTKRALESATMPLKVEQGWSIADSESKNALYWEFFKVISTPQGNKALCILCNNCMPVGASASELKRHLETESKKSVFSSKETEKERILATVHALAWRVCCKASAAEDQSTGSAGGPSIQTKAEIEWRMDVGNAVWVCTDKKSLRTLFTDAFRERERTVSCGSGACVPTTRCRLEQTIVSLYAAVKRRIFRVLERSREYFGNTPHLHLSADGWSPRSGAVLVHTCLSVLVPIGEQKVTTFERLNISLGARLCEFGEFQSISSDVLSKFLVAVLKEYGVQVPKADDVFDSHILSSTTDVGSNFGAANTMLKLEALPCLAHVLCNAVQWSLGLKAAQSKNPCAREFLVAMRDFTKGIRKRKVEAALKNWCTRNSRKLSKVTMYNDTRWNSSFLTMLQLLWLEEPLRRAFIGPATRNDFGTTQKEKSANKALADNWLDWVALRR